MKISEILTQRERGFSFEFFPPKTEKGMQSLRETARILKKYEPLYVSMTSGAGGTTRDATKEAVFSLLDEGGLDVMPHVTCLAQATEEISKLLDEYRERGVENIMALRGDPPLDGATDGVQGDFSYALDLVKLIKAQSNFCVGVAVYPEGHIETRTLDEDSDYTKRKIDTGADFAVTQMFFDNTHYYRFLERMNRKGINIPILPGILPLTNIMKVKEFASVCRASVPKRIEERLVRFKDRPFDMERIGVDFTIRQCHDLIQNGAKRIHFFTLNRPKTITTILDAIR